MHVNEDSPTGTVTTPPVPDVTMPLPANEDESALEIRMGLLRLALDESVRVTTATMPSGMVLRVDTYQQAAYMCR